MTQLSMHRDALQLAQSVFVRKDDDESAMEKLASPHEENNADPEEVPDPEEIGEEIEVRKGSFCCVCSQAPGGLPNLPASADGNGSWHPCVLSPLGCQ